MPSRRERSLKIDRDELAPQMVRRPELAQVFQRHMLTRNIRIEADLVDRLFNDAEKRLARTLLLMARFGKHEPPHRRLPRVSQQILAEMIGTTRPRVNTFHEQVSSSDSSNTEPTQRTAGRD